ncbi:MAG: CDP-alcohol phosphatidyltransferase family protein [Dehalococcoidia bacterium]
MRLADVLTASRIVASPIIVWLLISDEGSAAYYLFAAAAITDLLDGYFARRSGKLASYGAAFDGLADFFLIFPTMFALGVMGEATWLFAASLAAITYIVVVLGLISRKKGKVTVPHLNTNLLAAVVYPTIMVHMIQWQYAEMLLLFSFCVVVLPYYGVKYLLYLKSLY